MTLGTYQPKHCRAHTQAGPPCAAFPIHGGAVCVVHGGRAPQVKKAAAQRLAEMVDPLLTELFRIGQSGENEAVRVSAIKDALDRAGVGKDKALVNTAITFTLRIDRGDSND
jgi:hypothetical protein